MSLSDPHTQGQALKGLRATADIVGGSTLMTAPAWIDAMQAVNQGAVTLAAIGGAVLVWVRVWRLLRGKREDV